jgi:putative intracellular protease/amidase
MDVAIPIYDAFTALDAVGPYEVLSRLPEARVRFIAHEPGPVATDNGMLQIVAEASLQDVPEPDIVMVPGGFGTRALLDDEPLLSWLRHAHETSTWTTSVCTGSLLLAAAGILDGLEATTHWSAMALLGELGATPTQERVVVQGKVVTGAGVSAGIDMALSLAAEMWDETTAMALQLGIEYDPEPPFDAGSPERASSSTLRLAMRALLGDRPFEFARRVNGHAVRARAGRARRALRRRPATQ